MEFEAPIEDIGREVSTPTSSQQLLVTPNRLRKGEGEVECK